MSQPHNPHRPGDLIGVGWTLLGCACALSLSVIGYPAGAAESQNSLEGFSGYPGAPPFSVVPRRDNLEFYPCTACHEFMEPDPTVRELFAPHEIELNHGQGRIWCLTCHTQAGRDFLTTPLEKAVDFDDAHLVCGGCHSNRHKDWYFGAHGKRVANWHGERQMYNCTHCHDAHDPAIKPRAPEPAPKVRAGLARPESAPEKPEMPWEHRDREEEHGNGN